MTRRALLLALLLLPAASAQINDPAPYAADYGFSDPNVDAYLTVLSGRMEAHTAGSTGPYGFFDVEGFHIEGLERVCRGAAQCHQGELTVVVEDGGAAGMKFLTRPEVGYTADHALGLFLDARGDDLNSLQLNQSLLAPAVNGRVTFGEIKPVPDFGSFGLSAPDITLSPTSEETTVTVLDGASPVASWTGKGGVIALHGAPVIPAFDSEFVVLSFKEGSTARFTVADPAAARQGLDFERLSQVFQKLADASEGDQGQQGPPRESPLEEALSEVLDAALLRYPSSEDSASQASTEFALVIFESLEVSNQAGTLAWSGQAAFQLHGATVNGAQDLYGVWYLQLPWWGWALWVLAIGLFIARLAIKPDPFHERWDRYRWVGWAAGAAMFLLVFFLWDLEMRAVWGTSVLTTNTTGSAFWITFAIQMGTMALVMGAVSWPLSIIIKNSLLLARQGNFMGLGKPVSLLLAYALGATLMLAYIQLIVSSVIENLGA